MYSRYLYVDGAMDYPHPWLILFEETSHSLGLCLNLERLNVG